MIADKFLTEEEAAVIEENNILRLLDSPLGRRLAESPAVHRERQFNLIDQVEGNPVIVQGVIDCYFQEEDQLVLVDYKTSRIREGKEIEAEKRRIASQYETQISIYKKALETVTGMKVKDAYIYLTNCGELVEM